MSTLLSSVENGNHFWNVKKIYIHVIFCATVWFIFTRTFLLLFELSHKKYLINFAKIVITYLEKDFFKNMCLKINCSKHINTKDNRELDEVREKQMKWETQRSVSAFVKAIHIHIYIYIYIRNEVLIMTTREWKKTTADTTNKNLIKSLNWCPQQVSFPQWDFHS